FKQMALNKAVAYNTSLFVVMAISIRKSGIVRTDVAQRLSLFIPIIASFRLFDENLTTLKLVGIILGFIAIACSIPLKNNGRVKKVSAHAWIYLLSVFVGFGVIDVLFKQMALNKAVAYNTSLFVVFVLAFIFSLLGLIYRVMAKKIRFSWLHIPLGWMLGTVNFCNILFYLKAHKVMASNPSTVFSAVNIGVIVLGTLTGLIIFKEKLSLLNKAGIVLAVIAIIVIANS
ncbi:MAG TPA: EamA/RhaT family transporter, partial [Mucilaginibacter sp.]